MVVPGRVQNGVVVLKGGISLPEGAEVTVSCQTAPEKPAKGKRVRFPLVHSEHPGTLDLTNERIAEILDEEDVAHYSKFFLKHNEPQ
jgi:hypothetical protein